MDTLCCIWIEIKKMIERKNKLVYNNNIEDFVCSFRMERGGACDKNSGM